jgi:hypothetical protein
LRQKLVKTIPDKLLVAAAKLHQEGKDQFSAEELVVMSWKMFPDAFGLKGFQHPDSNRVFAEIMGSKPIRKRGYLEKIGTKLYRLTDLGKSTSVVLSADDTSGTRKIGSDRKSTVWIRKLLTNNAVIKFGGDREGDITFSDACSFLSITPGSSAIELEGRIRNITGLIGLLEQEMSKGDTVFVHGGKPITREDWTAISSTLELVLEKFSKQFDTIRKRTDER